MSEQHGRFICLLKFQSDEAEIAAAPPISLLRRLHQVTGGREVGASLVYVKSYSEQLKCYRNFSSRCFAP
jgi:hypothetical protein